MMIADMEVLAFYAFMNLAADLCTLKGSVFPFSPEMEREKKNEQEQLLGKYSPLVL